MEKLSHLLRKKVIKWGGYQKENDNIIEYRELLLNELRKRDKIRSKIMSESESIMIHNF